ncbi:hypothetical protein [Bizionia paragorgiae]|uniref:hypothetical protein n=1 Tax=Bizionia paragorgiae TaxID=283786 RepID=UPI003A903889
MDNTQSTGAFIASLLMSIVLGVISGIIWKFALDFTYKNAIIYGGLIGFVIGLLFAVSNNSAIKRGKFEIKEAAFASGSLLFSLFIISSIVAAIVGLISWVIS